MPLPPPPATCPKCRAPLPAAAPRGLCPACLMDAAGMETEVGVPADLFAAPLDLDTLRRAFPQLEILAPLGAGGMGRVYKVRQLNLDRIAALKVLPVELARDAAWVERFTREARALARLNHPNIVQIYDVGQVASGDGAEPLCWLLMEYVDGVTLRQVQRTGGLSAREALALVPRLCDAVQYAHEKGVLHRDIKPENILLDAAGTVKVADFGLAKLADARSAPGLTQAGMRLGTAAYMAPEQIESPGDVDHRADIYSLGVVLYELLTGGLPLGRFPAPSEKSGTDPRLDKIVFRTLEKERERRYQAAGEVKTALEGVEKSPDIPGERVRPAPRRMRDRGDAGPPLPSPGPQQTLFSTSQLILIAILLLILAIGISGGWRAAFFLLALVGGCGILLWLLVTLNGDHRRGMAALSGRTEVARRPQPHGCMAMLAFVAALVPALAGAVAGAMAVLKHWHPLPWLAMVGLCGVVSFLGVQPLLRLTGIHHSDGARRWPRLLGWTGGTLCFLGMLGGSFADVCRPPVVDRWDLSWKPSVNADYRLENKNVQKVVSDVFGPRAARCVSIRSTDNGQGWWLTASGTAGEKVDDLFLRCAAILEDLSSPPANTHNGRVKLFFQADVTGTDGISDWWLVLPFWLVAGGCWLLAIRARMRRKWLPAGLLLAVMAAVAWGVRYTPLPVQIEGWQQVIDRFLPADAGRDPYGDLARESAGPRGDAARATVVAWLRAMRTERFDEAKRMMTDWLGADMYKSLTPNASKRRFEVMRFGRILDIRQSNSEGVKDAVLMVHVAVLEESTGAHKWLSEYHRFVVGKEDNLISVISD